MRGEWTELPPLEGPVLLQLPDKPGEAEWSQRARDTWEAWREHPATAQLTKADIAFLVDTLVLVDRCACEPQASLAAEIRIRLDNVGLTPKGRQDRRWRIAPEDTTRPRFPSGPRQGTRRRVNAALSLDDRTCGRNCPVPPGWGESQPRSTRGPGTAVPRCVYATC